MWVYINMCTYIYIYVGFRKVLNSRSVCFNPAIALIIPNYTSIQAWTPATGPPQLRTGAASRPISIPFQNKCHKPDLLCSDRTPRSGPHVLKIDASIGTTSIYVGCLKPEHPLFRLKTDAMTIFRRLLSLSRTPTNTYSFSLEFSYRHANFAILAQM